MTRWDHRRAEAARVAGQLNSVITMAADAGSLDELREVIEDHQAVIGAAEQFPRDLRRAR
jgi:hypothetical protein